MIRVGVYYYEPNPRSEREDGSGYIWKQPRQFQCECCTEDAERICAALAVADHIRDNAVGLWQHLNEAVNRKASVTLAEPQASAA